MLKIKKSDIGPLTFLFQPQFVLNYFSDDFSLTVLIKFVLNKKKFRGNNFLFDFENPNIATPRSSGRTQQSLGLDTLFHRNLGLLR